MNPKVSGWWNSDIKKLARTQGYYHKVSYSCLLRKFLLICLSKAMISSSYLTLQRAVSLRSIPHIAVYRAVSLEDTKEI